MTASTSMAVSDTRQQLIELVVCDFIAQDADPRETTADDMLTAMSESLHWDALDADAHIDDELADADQLIRQIFTEYCLVKDALEGKATADGALIKVYTDAEAKAEAQFLFA
ncbi:hypothetical protein [Modicisalibacter xianhensis]|uniref:Uncharacterized protein n=1 Tax=Modicisalibacter xianhensis TaxID=442341 RepID=A0A1I3FRB3_9GAMM|nr:hypothetical protein [Halomonas xianhensis]SFI13773.1 hypothetical protein SAMN04487959_12057 [Halomonas xianhensis]